MKVTVTFVVHERALPDPGAVRAGAAVEHEDQGRERVPRALFRALGAVGRGHLADLVVDFPESGRPAELLPRKASACQPRAGCRPCRMPCGPSSSRRCGGRWATTWSSCWPRSQDIPPELYEAAQIDGAGRWSTFKSITLPMLQPVLVFIITLTIIASFNLLAQPMMMTRGDPRCAGRRRRNAARHADDLQRRLRAPLPGQCSRDVVHRGGDHDRLLPGAERGAPAPRATVKVPTWQTR